MAKDLLFCRYSFLLVFLLSRLLISYATGEGIISTHGGATAESFENGLVVSVDPIASEVGVEILRKGGNAVDAAVATGFALAVTHPSAGNIGGGGFMMVSLANTGEVHAVDYRERAPAASTPTMFLGSDGEVDLEKSGVGYLVIGVPGTVRGFWEVSQRFGTLEWAALVEPAVKLARDGFVVDEYLSESLNGQQRNMDLFPEFGRVYRKEDGSCYESGETMILPDLAWTLEQIRDNGAAGFYRGKVAERLVTDLLANGGIITLDDLAEYTAQVREPIHGTYRGYDIYGMPPSSSGGTTVVQILNMLENYALGDGERRYVETIHQLAEAMRIGFYNRAKYLGDTDYVDVDLAHLTSKKFVEPFHSRIDRETATASSELGEDIITRSESMETTHYSVVDGAGNMVSNTYTIEQSYGSQVIAQGTGFLLNNEMHDFNMNPGVTDTKGMIGTLPNLIEPGKRMLSSLSPTLVIRKGSAFLATGSPGGRTIINTVVQVIVNVIDFGMDVQAAVDEPRIHHQWMPDCLNMEDGFGVIEAAMQSRGHRTQMVRRQEDAHSILVVDGRLYAGVDRRLRGASAGY